MKRPYTVLILGAGAAGLACARELQNAGVDFHILEAKSRIGGRAQSLIKSNAVIEYGAEFIHGATPVILQLLAKYNSSFTDVCDNRLLAKKGKLYEAPKFWEDLEKITAELDPHRSQDRSIAEFINAKKSHFSSDLIQMFASYVEGYQAADLKMAGEKGLARSEAQDEPELNGQSLFRVDKGYRHFIELLFRDAGIRAAQISLNSAVEEIIWDKKQIQVRGKNIKSKRSFQKTADMIVITVPINVLKTSLKITPEIPALTKALAKIPMGHLQRITFEFSKPFWQDLADKPVAFIHTNTQQDFPTWWTQAPKRNPFLIAWQGGPRAYEMSAWSDEKKVASALKTLSGITHRSTSFLRQHLVQFYTHDWSQDPYTQGAYCYAGLETSGAPLKNIFAKRILLAGEGTAAAAELGTIHGAMKSGIRAAHQIKSERSFY